MKKSALLLLIVLAMALFFILGFDQYLTLDALKASQGKFQSMLAQSPWLVTFSCFALYVAVVALSLPGATLMTLAMGALFGLWAGTLLVSFASSMGATLAFLASRYLLRDTVQQRFGDRLKGINEGMEKDGALYLFMLRLVPAFPFVLINLLMGLTHIPVRTFYWISQLGMLAGTLVYVNAGTQLARIDSLSGILSPEVLLSFALLGIFPLIARQTARWVQKRRVYARWTRPRSFDRNLIVIGAGAAGLVSAYIGAAVKAKVTLIEGGKMGGDCLNYGCVPSKALIRSAKLAHQMATADRYGLERTMPRFSFKAVMARVHEVIRTIEPHDSVERYTRLGVEVLRGYARIADPWTVEIALTDGGIKRLTTRSIIIAAGARPVIPDVTGLDAVGYVTSDTVWDEFAKLDEAPKRLVVLGGGPIGCELAQCFARLGSQVTQLVRGARILEREDEDVSSLARTALETDGVEILTGHDLLYCKKNGGSKILVVRHAGVERRIEFDALLCAIGRTARLEGYGLESLGIPANGHGKCAIPDNGTCHTRFPLSKTPSLRSPPAQAGERANESLREFHVNRTVLTDEYLETIYPNIYAAGDVAGPYQFTHTAAHQAWYAAVNALFGDFKRFKADYSAVPRTTFIDPEVAHVGLNEQEAREKNIPFELTRYGIGDLGRAIADSAAYGFVKVLTVPGKDKILGVTIVGEHAGDLLAEYVLAMKHGLGLNKILGTIHTYPTLSEANKHAAAEWKLAHAPQRLLAWAERYHRWRRS